LSYTNLARVFAVAIILLGTIVIIGWFADIDSLKRIVPTWVTMKFSTAVSFLMTGIIVGLLNESRNRKNEFAKIFLFAPIMIILFFMATLLVSTIAGTTSGVSGLFVKEDPATAIGSITAGTPSVGTMINFLVIIGVGFTYLIARPDHTKYLNICGAIIIAIGIIALIGYAIESQALYYEVEGFSGAMALHTAIAFILSGIGLILLVKPKIVGTSISKSKFHLHISTKLVLFFLIASLIPIIVLGAVSIDLSKSSLEKESFLAVNAQADLTKRSVEVFFRERTSDALVTSEIEIFKKEMGTFDTFYNEPTNPQYIESDAKLDERLKLIRESYGYDNIMLTNSDGTIVFVSKNDRKETYLGNSFLQIDPDTFNEGKNGVYLSKVIEDVGGDGLPELYISAPIFDNDSNLIGVVIFDIPFKRLMDQAALTWYVGETGETLIVNKLGDKVVALHSLRFQEEVRFEEGIKIGDILAGPAQQAASGNDGTGFSIDYRGEEILAAWRYVKVIDWGLVAKIDTAEALAPIQQLEQDITILAIVFSIGVGFFGISASRSFSKPILELGNMKMKFTLRNTCSNNFWFYK